MSKIVLVGLPGCGKSTIGRILSRLLELPCIDLDAEVEKSLGCTIKSFFHDKGESQFRLIESDVLGRLMSKPDAFVLATGGGVVLKKENRLLIDQALVVYLMSQPHELAKRLRNDQVRPLLQTSDVTRTLVDLYETRHPLYEEVADIVIPTAGKSASKIATAIVELIPK